MKRAILLFWTSASVLVAAIPVARGGDPRHRSPATAVWHDFPDETPYLNSYQTNGWSVAAGFVPDQAVYVWGEPIHFITYVISNTGPKTVSFQDGGDYRGGRSEGHQLTAIDADGQAVEVPPMHHMGGIVSLQKLEPGEVYRKLLPVERRLIFKGPGTYMVTGRRTLVLGESFESRPRGIKLSTSNTFSIAIRPYSPASMVAVIDRLATRIRANGAVIPRPNEYTEPTDFSAANQQWLDLATLAAIKDPAALNQLRAMARQSGPVLRAAALRTLGGFTDDRTQRLVLGAQRDPDPAIRAAAAEALGSMKTDAAVTGLLEQLPGAEPAVAADILRALGHTRSPRAWKSLIAAVNGPANLRRAAADGLVAFGGPQAVDALRNCVGDADLDFREYVVRQLAESLRQPIDPWWLVPVIQARKGEHSIGDAPRLMRLYGGEPAVPALLSGLDFADPSIRKYYNWALIYEQGWCQGGLKIPWTSDLNRDSTPAELERNARLLKTIRAWVDHYRQYRMDEVPPTPAYRLGWAEEEKTYGDPVDGLRVRATVNQRVWPDGLLQLVTLTLLAHPAGGSVTLTAVPPALEVEVNGRWYVHQPPLAGPTEGIDAGHGSSFQHILLDEHWIDKTDGQPLRIVPGQYTVRIALSRLPANERTGLALSRPVAFSVIGPAGP